MGSITKNTSVSRFIVPFYFDSQDGYENAVEFWLNEKNTEKMRESLGLTDGGKWVEQGFWSQKDSNKNIAEMDIFSFLLDTIEGNPDDNNNKDNSLGKSLIYSRSDINKSLKLSYLADEKTDKYINFRFSDFGLIVFKDGIGFFWYDIDFMKSEVSKSEYIDIQAAFKELVRKKDSSFFTTSKVKRENEDGTFEYETKYEHFCFGEWIYRFLCADRLDIKFWAERLITDEKNSDNRAGRKIAVPDKALLFQYVFSDFDTESDERSKIAFWIANGYNEKYSVPDDIDKNIYEPFGNVSIYSSRAGIAYVADNRATNKAFFENGFVSRYCHDYFFMYILILYQSYSCMRYSKTLTMLPAKRNVFDYETDAENGQSMIDRLDILSSEINLFLVKSTYESVSNVHHQNEYYRYCKDRMHINEDFASLTVGLDALRKIERARIDKRVEDFEQLESKRNERNSRILDRGLAVFGFLMIISAVLDGITLVDKILYPKEGEPFTLWHMVPTAIIIVFSIAMLIVLLYSRDRGDKKGKKKKK